MERMTFKILFYIKKTRIAKNGEVPVMLRVTVNGFRAETSVNLKAQANSMQKQYAADLARQKQAHEAETSALQHKHETKESKLQRELDDINYWLPDTEMLIKYADYCRGIGFSVEQTKDLLADKPIQYTGELKYHEYNRSFKANDAEICLESTPAATDSGTPFRLTINDGSLKNWFKEQYDKWLQRLGVSQKPQQGRGIKI